MKLSNHKRIALYLAVCLAAMPLVGCGESVKQFFAHDGPYGQSSTAESVPTETILPAETTATSETTASSAETTTTTSAATAESTTTSTTESTAPIATSEGAQDTDTKLLWSERGLEIVPVDSTEGYGEELKAGESYLNWTLRAFDGTVSGSTVNDLHADFDYDGSLSCNGILTILPASDADNPSGLSLRVDNQADFPYFPADSRERGKFIVENKDEVIEMLGLDGSETSVAVTMSITKLHVHYNPNGFDTITVTAASKR